MTSLKFDFKNNYSANFSENRKRKFIFLKMNIEFEFRVDLLIGMTMVDVK